MSDASLLPGAVLPAERETHTDRKSGLPVTRYTAGQGHSNHCYFNVEGLWDEGRQLLVCRDLGGGSGLFSLDLATGAFRRLTPPATPQEPLAVTAASLAPRREEAFYWLGRSLWGVHLRSCERRRVAELPEGYAGDNTAVTCDERSLVTVIRESGGSGGPQVSTEERCAAAAARRDSRLIAVDLGDGRIGTLHRSDEHLLGHANPSPTDPDLLTFCHEGPWLEIDQRIWGLRCSAGAPWPIVPRVVDWGVGHEFWFADGRTLGYHARHREGTWRHTLGWAAAEGGAAFQAEVAVPTHHAHAVSPERYVLDGTRASGDHLLVVERSGDGWSTPHILCAHDSSRWQHRSHAHPHVCPDGRTVVFSSDRCGYADVYSVTIPEELDELPLYPGPPYRYYWE